MGRCLRGARFCAAKSRFADVDSGVGGVGVTAVVLLCGKVVARSREEATE
jgi:hypothetical protein